MSNSDIYDDGAPFGAGQNWRLGQARPDGLRAGDRVLGWIAGPFFTAKFTATGPGVYVEELGAWKVPVDQDETLTIPEQVGVIYGRTEESYRLHLYG
ncbi:hypothetical protein ACN20G_29820 (plasmid) [Streptomyces sp. BI20]|uniref:hypothetical protein n=1 Tax=Streptomyces sp. BI20 TaxID=3403460 RepID=UPI003C77066B